MDAKRMMMHSKYKKWANVNSWILLNAKNGEGIYLFYLFRVPIFIYVEGLSRRASSCAAWQPSCQKLSERADIIGWFSDQSLMILNIWTNFGQFSTFLDRKF